MMNKKMKCGLGIICMTAGLLVGGMTASAASYVQSNMPQYSNISCWGSIGFSGGTMTATTSSNGATWHQTTVAGTLTKNGVSLGRDSRNGETKAVLQEAGANGYLDGSGIHKAGYRNSTWNGNTNL